MIDVAPLPPPLIDPPRRDRRIVATVAVSVLLHALVLGWLLLPPAKPAIPAEPTSIDVDLIPPSAVSSLEPPASSEPPSSQPVSTEPSSTEPSSDLPSSEAPASDGAPSSAAPPPSGASQSEEASSASVASSAEASSGASSAEEASAMSSAEPTAAASAAEPPSGAPPSSTESASAAAPSAPPLVIPVGPGASEDTSSVADASVSAAAADTSADASGASATEPVLATTGTGAGDSVDAATGGAPPPVSTDLLHAAKRFYLADMLKAPGLAKAKAALKKLPADKRLAQTCNIEAIAQIGNAGKGFAPDAIIASAFAPPVLSGTTYSVANGAFRSKQKWYGAAYTCTLSPDLTSVKAFALYIGGDVTTPLLARTGPSR